MTESAKSSQANGARLQPDVELLLAAAEVLNSYLDSVGEISPELRTQKRQVMAKIFEECEAVLD